MTLSVFLFTVVLGVEEATHNFLLITMNCGSWTLNRPFQFALILDLHLFAIWTSCWLAEMEASFHTHKPQLVTCFRFLVNISKENLYYSYPVITVYFTKHFFFLSKKDLPRLLLCYYSLLKRFRRKVRLGCNSSPNKTSKLAKNLKYMDKIILSYLCL